MRYSGLVRMTTLSNLFLFNWNVLYSYVDAIAVRFSYCEWGSGCFIISVGESSWHNSRQWLIAKFKFHQRIPIEHNVYLWDPIARYYLCKNEYCINYTWCIMLLLLQFMNETRSMYQFTKKSLWKSKWQLHTAGLVKRHFSTSEENIYFWTIFLGVIYLSASSSPPSLLSLSVCLSPFCALSLLSSLLSPFSTFSTQIDVLHPALVWRTPHASTTIKRNMSIT